jgi:hypothetical protein
MERDIKAVTSMLRVLDYYLILIHKLPYLYFALIIGSLYMCY